ncbi:MAG: prolipoprotein diacylglyceryl transferase, partial [Lachnospiraceae bacterium]|nr:prolipoprotein diacylglyceryl transferase [Lachnospiraceae bacterium]
MNTGIDISFPHIGIQIENLGKGITIGSFTIAYYGMIIAFGMVAGLFLARWQAKRTGQNPDFYSDFALYAIIFSIIGARLYYVIFSFDQYKNNLIQVFNIRGGGMAIYGAVITAVITAILYCRKKNYSFFLLADTACGGLILGQIIGRWGNFMNREAFGGYTDNFFAMRLKESEVAAGNITEPRPTCPPATRTKCPIRRPIPSRTLSRDTPWR